MTVKRCDNASVGVIITGPQGLLMFDRNTFPVGVAPVAGHVFDDHAGYTEAACAEVTEELGLTVASLELVTGGWRPNRCRRAAGPRGIGHQWQVFNATVTGTLAPSARETRNARWIAGEELQSLSAWTSYYARSVAGVVPKPYQVSAQEFAARPGIEPVWVQWLTDAGAIRCSAADLAVIDDLAASLTPEVGAA
ncbi:NUDIX domain-containing protein [Actinoallomurus sp. CA-142502]|uniref:NUDIX domain-containing protein n=1 Tax=Actinoallomurus sp. CA-142502 TaxID=3239885 RepID=UPI003D8E6E4A